MGQPRAPLWLGIWGLSEQLTPVGCFENADRTKVFKKTKSQPLINRKWFTVSHVHFLSRVLVAVGKNGVSVEGGGRMLLCGLKGQLLSAHPHMPWGAVIPDRCPDNWLWLVVSGLPVSWLGLDLGKSLWIWDFAPFSWLNTCGYDDPMSKPCHRLTSQGYSDPPPRWWFFSPLLIPVTVSEEKDFSRASMWNVFSAW